MSLTAKRKAFVREYPIDLNATKAAIRAGFSEKTAYSQGQRLLKNVEVADAIQKALAERSERTEITQDYVLTSIMDVNRRSNVTPDRRPILTPFARADGESARRASGWERGA